MLSTRTLLVLLTFLLVSSPAGAQRTRATPASARLHAIIGAAWEFELRENPLLATSVGDRRYDDRLPGMSQADQKRRQDSLAFYLKRLGTIDRRSLARHDRINAAMLEDRLRTWLDDIEGEVDRIPILADDGFHISLAQLPARTPHQTATEVEKYIARLGQTPRYFREHIALMRRGLETGFTMPRVVLDGYDVTIGTHIVTALDSSVFFKPLTQLPEAMPSGEKERLRLAARTVIRDSVIPAYREFLAFMSGEYIPGARQTIAASDLPGGAAYYRRQIRKYTTLDLSADSIHTVGLSEVARIRAEMETAMRRSGFAGTLAEFIQMLRTDARFYPTSAEQLLERASWIAKRMDGKLPSLFSRLPRAPYGVDPVPAHLAPKYTAGRYVNAPPGSTESSKYWVNTYNLPSRPFYALEALTLHEAVPGHHLQISLARELDGLPDFRRFTYISAFGEGWGLYSERLGLEAGFYTDPYSDFGRLTYEMWRACRLVVDTGIHSKGWTRDRVLSYMAEHTALSLHEVRTETDRYISWPAQALAYKLGEIKIRELRALAERSLGDRFDVRKFHDAILRNGSVPLLVLEAEVKEYLAEK
ncbi:MAG: DUF885 family protein [Gemmatimonadaceae bacterium]